MPSDQPIDSSDDLCHGEIHPQALLGIQDFNSGHFFEAHEALETAWKAETSSIRNLYRGILQVAVAYHHLCHGNYRGARKMFQRCRIWLEPFPDACLGLDIAQFKQDYLLIEARLLLLELYRDSPPAPESLPHIHFISHS